MLVPLCLYIMIKSFILWSQTFPPCLLDFWLIQTAAVIEIQQWLTKHWLVKITVSIFGETGKCTEFETWGESENNSMLQLRRSYIWPMSMPKILLCWCVVTLNLFFFQSRVQSWIDFAKAPRTHSICGRWAEMIWKQGWTMTKLQQSESLTYIQTSQLESLVVSEPLFSQRREIRNLGINSSGWVNLGPGASIQPLYSLGTQVFCLLLSKFSTAWCWILIFHRNYIDTIFKSS